MIFTSSYYRKEMKEKIQFYLRKSLRKFKLCIQISRLKEALEYDGK